MILGAFDRSQRAESNAIKSLLKAHKVREITQKYWRNFPKIFQKFHKNLPKNCVLPSCPYFSLEILGAFDRGQRAESNALKNLLNAHKEREITQKYWRNFPKIFLKFHENLPKNCVFAFLSLCFIRDIGCFR